MDMANDMETVMGDDNKAAVDPFAHLLAMEIEDFCRINKICRSSYYNLRKKGKGPRETRMGKRIIITPEAHAEWREKQTAPAAPVAAE
jgi:hypothetical protein